MGGRAVPSASITTLHHSDDLNHTFEKKMLALLADCESSTPRLVCFYDDDQEEQALERFRQEAQSTCHERDLEGEEEDVEVDWCRLVSVCKGTWTDCPDAAIALYHPKTQIVTAHMC